MYTQQEKNFKRREILTLIKSDMDKFTLFIVTVFLLTYIFILMQIEDMAVSLIYMDDAISALQMEMVIALVVHVFLALQSISVLWMMARDIKYKQEPGTTFIFASYPVRRFIKGLTILIALCAMLIVLLGEGALIDMYPASIFIAVYHVFIVVFVHKHIMRRLVLSAKENNLPYFDEGTQKEYAAYVRGEG